MIAKTYSKKADKCRVTFRIPVDIEAESVSVLGEFNDWDPQAHPLKARKNGTFSTTMSLEAGQTYRFRYLADGEIWLNDEEADGLDLNQFGSLDSVLAV
jgi:1,4-alpha-glucan branching enzyme